MCVLFGGQDVLDLVNDEYVSVAEDAMESQINAQSQMRKKDQKELFYIHQCVDANMIEKIVDSITVKVALNKLVWCYNGDASVKKVKLHSLCEQYKNLNMKNNKKIPDYVFKVILIINEMNYYGETLSKQVIIENILKYLTP